MKHVSETLAKNTLKTIKNHCKHMQRPDKTLATDV
jgi:hypothetical protein